MVNRIISTIYIKNKFILMNAKPKGFGIKTIMQTIYSKDI